MPIAFLFKYIDMINGSALKSARSSRTWSHSRALVTDVAPVFTSVACHKNLATTHTLNTRAVDEPLRKNRASRQHHLWIGSPLICQTSDTKESTNRSNSTKALEMHFFPTRCKLFTCSCRRNLSCQHQMLEGFSRSGKNNQSALETCVRSVWAFQPTWNHLTFIHNIYIYMLERPFCTIWRLY